MKRAFLLTLVFWLLFCVHAWAEPVTVFVSILPQKYFLEQIGGDLVDVRVMVEPGANPATYEPKPAQMAGLSSAAAYFAVGVPFEQVWLDRITSANPDMLVVHTDSCVPKIRMQDQYDSDADIHCVCADQAGLDPHIWLSPPLVMLQARAILRGLLEIDPANTAVYQDNYRRFIDQVADLDLAIMNVLAGKADGGDFMVFHPSWGYFARAYGLRQIPVEIEGKSPKPREMARLIDLARKKNIRVVFVQPQFSKAGAEAIAREIKGQTAVMDPLAEDWAENLRRAAHTFAQVLK